MTGNRLSIDRIARRWAAEYDQADIQASDIEDDLLTAVLHGEFEFSVTPPFEFNIPPPQEFPEDPEEPEVPETPKNFDARRRVLVETFDRDRAPVNSGKLQIFLNTRMSAPGARVEEARRFIARDIFISIQGFRLWCDRPEFTEWAQGRGLSRPQFIDEQGAAPTEPSSPQNAASRVGERPGGEDTSPNESILKIPGHSAASLAEYIEWEKQSTIYEGDGSNKREAAVLIRTEFKLDNVEAEYIAKMVRQVRRWRKVGTIPE